MSSVEGDAAHWQLNGVSSVCDPTPRGFRLYTWHLSCAAPSAVLRVALPLARRGSAAAGGASWTAPAPAAGPTLRVRRAPWRWAWMPRAARTRATRSTSHRCAVTMTTGGPPNCTTCTTATQGVPRTSRRQLHCARAEQRRWGVQWIGPRTAPTRVARARTGASSAPRRCARLQARGAQQPRAARAGHRRRRERTCVRRPHAHVRERHGRQPVPGHYAVTGSACVPRLALRLPCYLDRAPTGFEARQAHSTTCLPRVARAAVGAPGGSNGTAGDARTPGTAATRTAARTAPPRRP